MQVKKIIEPEGQLLNFIYNISPLEWRRFQQRYPKAWIKDHFEIVDNTTHPPYISFRFSNEHEVVIERLREAIRTYSGKISWILSEHKRKNLVGTNWTIEPTKLLSVKKEAIELNLTPSQYLAKFEPNFGIIAYEDLEGLTNHIIEFFPEFKEKFTIDEN